jgi:hypothetical protein
VKNFLDGLGYTRLILKTDQEPAIMKLAQEVKNKRTHGTVLVKGQKYSHQSMGFIENANGRIEEQTRVIILRLEDRYKISITADSPMLPWIVRHAAWLLGKYSTNESGQTAHRILRGKNYDGVIVEFGEVVWWKRPQLQQAKLEARWLSGLWVGKVDSSDEHMIIMKDKVEKCRAIRRKSDADRWDKKIFEESTARPWTNSGLRTDEARIVQRRKYITSASVARHGKTAGCKACDGQSKTHSAACRKRCDGLFETETGAEPVQAEVSEGQPADDDDDKDLEDVPVDDKTLKPDGLEVPVPNSPEPVPHS